MHKLIILWRERVKTTKETRNKYELIHYNYSKGLLQKSIQGWKEHNYIQKKLVKKICRIGKTYQDYEKLYAFTQINHFGQSRVARKSERKQHACADIAYLLHSIYKKTTSSTLSKMRLSCLRIDQDRKLCKRIFMRSYLSQLKQAFSKWKHNHMKSKLIEEINTESDIAVEAVRAKRRVNILKKFLVQHGHSKRDIDEELERKKQKTKSLMKSFVIRCFFKTSKFSVLPKAFNHLKAWVRTRKLYRENFETMSKYKNSEIFWAFKRWKHYHEDLRKPLLNLSKVELIEKCIRDEQTLGSLHNEQSRKRYQINVQLAQREQLLENFATAQKIAFRRCEYKLRIKPLKRAFLKWQRNAVDAKLEEIEEQSNTIIYRKNQSVIEELMKICKEAEEKNNDLILENEELRQASLDGIEIAKAVQELTREREKLSEELGYKNIAIKQLINDNNDMSEQLNRF